MKTSALKTGILCVIACLISFNWATAQTTKLETKPTKHQLKSYIKLGLGIGSAKFRDFATSPLLYSGNPYEGGVSLLFTNDRREIEIGGAFSYGEYTALAISTVNVFQGYYRHLFQIPLSSKSWNVKVGGELNAVGTYRINNSLLNNSEGFELFTNLMAVGQIEKDISLKERWEKKIWFLKIKLRPRRMKTSFKTRIGVVNTALRNGFAYTGQSALLNESVLLDDYEFKAFSGFRMGTEWNFTYFLTNGNAFQLSYLWDVWKSASQPDKFEMAQHTLRFSLLFNTNKR